MIDRLPPSQTGKPSEDIKKVIDYLYYLREQINLILRQVENERHNKEK